MKVLIWNTLISQNNSYLYLYMVLSHQFYNFMCNYEFTSWVLLYDNLHKQKYLEVSTRICFFSLNYLGFHDYHISCSCKWFMIKFIQKCGKYIQRALLIILIPMLKTNWYRRIPVRRKISSFSNHLMFILFIHLAVLLKCIN